jgi:hypothetical protein
MSLPRVLEATLLTVGNDVIKYTIGNLGFRVINHNHNLICNQQINRSRNIGCRVVEVMSMCACTHAEFAV